MPTHIHDNYLITLVHSLSSREYKQDRTEVSNKHMGTVVDYKQKGRIIIRYLWEKGTDCMLDMRVVNTYSKSYQMRPPEKGFMKAEKNYKYNYLDSCIQQRWTFSLFVASFGGLVVV